MTLPSVDVAVFPKVEDEVTENDGFGHFVRIKALLEGGPVVALCGKKFVPKTIAEAGEKEPCAKCAELMAFLELLDNS
jgi:hypothetical protein